MEFLDCALIGVCAVIRSNTVVVVVVSCIVLSVVLLMCWVDHVWHCTHFSDEERAGCFTFHHENIPI